MTAPDDGLHRRWVVRNSQSGRFVGSRRFSYSTGSYAGSALGLKTARLFTKKDDAENACADDDDEVLEVSVRLEVPFG